ncbi:MAG TPA: preprotein translocase subunit YajC [Clostridiales bacterium]|nr:preprotein translocase subunit YajC [Clostridiales bacterium]
MPGAETYLSFIPLILLFVLFYVLMIRPQRKREKEDRAMRESIVAGDRICTIGGIVGKVLSVNEEEVVVESSGSRLTLNKWAIRSKVEKN